MKNLNAIEAVFEKAHAEKRTALLETEVYAILALSGLSVPKRFFYALPELDPSAAALELVAGLEGPNIVIKIVSSGTLHKTESGGVKIVARERGAVAEALKAMREKFPGVEGLMACEFAEHSPFALGEELMLGARADDAFGPVITLGAGGTNAEDLTASLRPGVSPAIVPAEFVRDGAGWRDFLAKCWIWRYTAGRVRGAKRLVDDGEMVKWLEAFAGIMKHFRDGGDGKFAIVEFEVNPVAVSKGRLVALDGVLRFRPAQKKGRVRPSKKGVAGLLHPRSVAVTGVSEKKMNMARIILNNVVKAGFDRKRVYVIKEGIAEIDGVKCCADPGDLPETVDMFVVAVPSSEVPGVLERAGASGKVNGVVLISGGMGEKAGSEDIGAGVVRAIERAREKNPDFVLSGGNSLGIVLPRSRVNTLFIPEYKLAYPLGENPHIVRTAFVSQSGAFVISSLSKMAWLKPVYSVTVGNQQDATVVDYVERLSEEDDIKVLLIYLEGFKYADGLLLAGVIEKARKKGKQVIVYKAGRTAVGCKAVMGHTASIAGDYLVTKSILEAAGALAADSFDDFNDLAAMACYFSNFNIRTGNTFFLSNAGFESAGMADGVGGSVTAEMKDEKLIAGMQEVLKGSKLDGIVDVKNPLDVTPMAPDAAIGSLTDLALGSGEFGAVVLSMVPLTPAMNTLPKGGGEYPDDLDRSFLKRAAERMKQERKPLIFCVAAGALYDPYCGYAQELGIPVFRSADRAVHIYRKYLEYAMR
ncbi:MAG: acetate--CoA ligase family protein [Elusimicrobiales bacterium]|jgi:acyl-CoA synthetase (NDP forming)